jgi:hypothetical protein
MTAPIGVLLPVRLETLVEARDDGGRTLLLRVIPDDAHLDHHDARCTDAELDLLDAVWAAGVAGFDAAYATLVERVGGPRALWITRTFPAGYNRGSVPLRVPGVDPPGYTKVIAFPSRYQVWALMGGMSSLLADQVVSTEKLVLDPLAPVGNRWWSDWAKAVEVGLGVEIDLGAIDPAAANFEALFVIGVDDNVDPSDLFIDHANAGRLALIEHGTPTNTVAGVPAVDMKGTPAEWRTLYDAPQPLAVERLGAALGVPAPGLPPIRVGPHQTQSNPNLTSGPWDGELVAALWSVLWGFAGHELWGWGDAVHEAADWAARWLRPLGPLAPLRIGDEPYGVLPVTSLGRWKAAAGDPPLESVLLPRLESLRAMAATAAQARGTTSDADAARWLELMADTPTTPVFGARWMLPLTLAQLLSPNPNELQKWWNTLADVVLRLAGRPKLSYVAISETLPISIAFVHPVIWDPDGKQTTLVQKMLDTLADFADKERWSFLPKPWYVFVSFRPPDWNERDAVPDSLLVRLAWRSLMVAAGHAVVERTGKSLLDPPWVNQVNGIMPNPVLDDIVTSAGPLLGGGDPATRVLLRTISTLRSLAASTDEELEIAFRAVLDTASHRVDPWITALATRRLFAFRGAGTTTAAGIYGWVDGPLLGTPGPTAGGVLLATSDSQARTSAVLRDKVISDPEKRWAMNLESLQVAAAVRLADDIAAGAHPGEAVGRRVEHDLAMRDRIDEARRRFPLRAGDQGRRVCDGLALLAPGSDLSWLTPAEHVAIDALRPMLDTYADLLIADGVHQVIEGRPERAQRSMQAASGLGVPPDLDVVRSPRPGRTAATTVLIALPAAGEVDAARPVTLVDAAVAAYVDAALPAPANAAWTWTVNNADGTTATLRLDALALTPMDVQLRASDALALGRISLDQMVKQQTGAVAIASQPEALAQGERLLALLRSTPYVDAEPSQPKDDAARLDLVARYQVAREAAKSLLLQARQLGLPPGDQQKLLSSLRPWGVLPTFDPATPMPAQSLLVAAAASLAARLSATPPQPSASDPAGTPEPATAASLDAAALASALIRLVCPASAFVVLARRDPSLLAALREPMASELSDWLGIVATVRARLAVHDADQLDAATLIPRHDRPGDIWQQAGVSADGSTRLVVAFGAGDAFDGGAAIVALGEIDRFTEAVPAVRASTAMDAEERVLTAAVGFNAPAARAPQAILLAVPPDPGETLDAATLFDIVRETRQLAHARMARLTDLGPLAAVLPATWLPKAWVSGVELTVDREI